MSSYVCPCNNRDYKSRGFLNTHEKSRGHRAWCAIQENIDMKSKINCLENEICDLKEQVRRSNDVNYYLVSQFRSGENSN